MVNLIENKEKENNGHNNQKNNEKEIASIISSKILDYKTKLDTVPVQIVPIDQTETDRSEVNELYSEIKTTNNQLLDSKFYTQLLKMNRERDKSFLKEGTTRQERITILAQIISRVTTPLIFLNHKRNVQLNSVHIFNDEKKSQKKNEIQDKTNYMDPETAFILPNELTVAEIQDLRRKLIEKLENKTWNKESFTSLQLADWEADILSQLTRDEELHIIIDKKNNKIQITRNQGAKKKKSIISFLIEAKKSI